MDRMVTAQVAQASRIFLDLAYPAGPETIPARVRLFHDLPADQPMSQFLPPIGSRELTEVLTGASGEIKGYSLRLGSSGFPHLKLQLHLLQHAGQEMWIYAVDTHDNFSRKHYRAPADHPEAKLWHSVQGKNQVLKERIELAWQEAHLPTFLTLLAEDLVDVPALG